MPAEAQGERARLTTGSALATTITSHNHLPGAP